MKTKRFFVLFAFYFLSFTWALPTTLMGAVIALFIRLTGHKFKKFGPVFYTPMGSGWGLELGLFFIGSKVDNYGLKCHETGHQLQACFLLGPLQTFVGTIPSILRYWLRKFKTYYEKTMYSLIVSGSMFAAVFLLFIIFEEILWMKVLLAILACYVILLSVWLVCIEREKYAQEPYPAYDDFWIEKYASKYGKKFIGDWFPEED